MSPNTDKKFIITAGATYLDIDAYACMVAMAELLTRRGENAVSWSAAAHNYSVCPSLVEDGQILRELPGIARVLYDQTPTGVGQESFN